MTLSSAPLKEGDCSYFSTDVEERGQWAARCTGVATLGTIVSAVMRERDALWLAGALPAPSITSLRWRCIGSGVTRGCRAGGFSCSLRDGTQLPARSPSLRCRVAVWTRLWLISALTHWLP